MYLLKYIFKLSVTKKKKELTIESSKSDLWIGMCLRTVYSWSAISTENENKHLEVFIVTLYSHTVFTVFYSCISHMNSFFQINF